MSFPVCNFLEVWSIFSFKKKPPFFFSMGGNDEATLVVVNYIQHDSSKSLYKWWGILPTDFQQQFGFESTFSNLIILFNKIYLPMISDGAGTLGVFTGKIGVEGLEREAKNLKGFSGLIRWDSNLALPLATAPLGMLIPFISLSLSFSLFTWLPMIVESLELENMFVTLSITVPLVIPILVFPSWKKRIFLE